MIYFILVILNLSFSLIFLYINILYIFISICLSFYHLQIIEYEEFMSCYLYASIITLLWQQLKTHPMSGCRTTCNIRRRYRKGTLYICILTINNC